MVLSFGVAFGIHQQLQFSGILVVVGLFWLGAGFVLGSDLIDPRPLPDRGAASIVLNVIGKMICATAGIVGLMWIFLALLLFVSYVIAGRLN